MSQTDKTYSPVIYVNSAFILFRLLAYIFDGFFSLATILPEDAFTWENRLFGQ